MTPVRIRRACLSVLFLAPLCGFADSVVVLHADVKNAPSPSTFAVPIAGDYTFTTSKNDVRAQLPDGSVMLFDFQKQTVTDLDPAKKSYFVLKMADFLALGEKLAPMFSKRFGLITRSTLETLVGQDDIRILDHDATPYNLYLGAHLDPFVTNQDSNTAKPKAPRGGTQGGQKEPDTPVEAYLPPSSTGVEIAGAIWLSDFQPADADRAELAFAESCTLFRGAPGLRALTDRQKKANQTLMSGDVSFSVLDSDGAQPADPPMVSFEIKSVKSTTSTPSDFMAPLGFTKAPAPTLQIGSPSSEHNW